MKQPIAQRFYSKVSVSENGCHEWTGSRLKGGGYGQFHKDGKTVYAHRVAWELAKGPCVGLYVLHKCDNRKCVNPDHLFLGSFQDNMDDMVNKRRHAHGIKNGHAKLSTEDVLKIRSAIGTQTEIAKKFNTSQAIVSEIKAKKIWKYV